MQEHWKTNAPPSTPRRRNADVISINAESGEIVSNFQSPEDGAETDSLLSQRLNYGSTTNFEPSTTNFEPSPAGGVVDSGRRRRRHSLQTERELLRQRYVSGESNRSVWQAVSFTWFRKVEFCYIGPELHTYISMGNSPVLTQCTNNRAD